MVDLSTVSLKDLAGFLAQELRKRGIETVLVGGACATIYSNNRYQSYDLDYVTFEDMKQVQKALTELGFIGKQGYFKHKTCPWIIEFVTPPVSIGMETIKKFNEVITPLGTIQLLRPVDSVKDRLASFYHWDDKEGLEQAVNICLEHNIHLKEVETWSLREGQKNKFLIFKDLLKSKKTSS